MKLPELTLVLTAVWMLALPGPAHALRTDRQQPLEVNADSTEGTLGDGTATLQGNVEIQQGTMLIRADRARVEKIEGRVRRVILDGSPVHLQQEIEQEGLVTAEARKIEYEVATGIVTLTGNADVIHPQYRISGETLKYDMNAQHFQGSGGEENGRIRIQMDPEVVPGTTDSEEESAPETAADQAPADDAPADDAPVDDVGPAD
ncbi:MAG: lipopolysaccharide transport periplasmic protein LptA [Xanthomonadales bacterium]|nr:lipopolysaccharide transport periplasmic protein LptA [Xanthomonadales bacterium]